MAKRLLVVGAPNGAGKTTFVRRFIDVHDDEYLGADAIAVEIFPDNPEAFGRFRASLGDLP